MGPDRAKLKFSGQRTIVRVPVLKLPFIKAIKNAAHVTLNDVIYAAMAGACVRACVGGCVRWSTCSHVYILA
jgi:hypothetical protein